jgi:hypothetical protein
MSTWLSEPGTPEHAVEEIETVLAAVQGHMMNALFALEVGAKREAIGTLKRGIDLIRAASAMSAGTAETTQIGSGPQDRQRDPQGDAQNPSEWR